MMTDLFSLNSDNNVGDIVNVGVYANLDVKNKIDYTNISAEIIWKNLQAIILALDRDNDNGIGGGPGNNNNNDN